MGPRRSLLVRASDFDRFKIALYRLSYVDPVDLKGIEPPTSAWQMRRSPVELQTHDRLLRAGFEVVRCRGVNHLHAADPALPVFACPTPSLVARQEERSRAPADRVEQIQTCVDQVAHNSAP
jgi:hypothetical protein